MKWSLNIGRRSGFGYEPDLQLLVEMFGAQVDPEVIKLVWQQAGCCGSTALDALVNVESHLPPSAVSVLSSVARGDRVLVLMRGASGSGKSTLAKCVLLSLSLSEIQCDTPGTPEHLPWPSIIAAGVRGPLRPPIIATPSSYCLNSYI